MRPPAALPPIRTDHSNAFANNTMRVRLPAIIDETIALNPDYPASIKRRLAGLRNDIANGARIHDQQLSPAGDTDSWAVALQRQREIVVDEPTWHNAEWFFAETYAYRCLVEAVRWHETGRDPFLPKKLEELHGEALWQLVKQALSPADSAADELRRAVAFDLWANRIDLSYAASLERGADISPEDWLVDERDALLSALCASADGGSVLSGRVHIIADNAGSELAMDLILADTLLRHVVERVDICLKWHPTFVSDATPVDVWLMLAEMKRRAPALADRLYRAWDAEDLRFLPHPYWNSSRFLWDRPSDIRESFADSRSGDCQGRCQLSPRGRGLPLARAYAIRRGPALSRCAGAMPAHAQKRPGGRFADGASGGATRPRRPAMARQRQTRPGSVQTSDFKQPGSGGRGIVALQPSHDFLRNQAIDGIARIFEFRIQDVLLYVTFADAL